jgi:tetratricopeptide (TPR) repeat protein
MRGQTSGLGTVDMVVRAVLEEFPGLDKDRVRAAVERGNARAANAALNTEGHRIIDLQLQRVEATEESSERAQILRELSENLEEKGDAERGLAVRLAAFSEAGNANDIDPLLRLARITDRWTELPLEAMTPLVKINDDASRRLTDIAFGWQKHGRAYDAADCLERVLAIDPLHDGAHEALELFYRSTQEWPSLIELLNRRAVNVEKDAERAELYREMGVIYDQYLADDGGALDAYREADKLEPDRPDVLEAIARLGAKVGMPGEEALESLQRLANTIADPMERARVLARAGDVAKLHDWDLSGKLYDRARTDDPDYVPAIDGLVGLWRDRGELGRVIELLEQAAARPSLVAERSRWLADAADYCVAQGETEKAKTLYREARVADPSNHKAGLALVELCSDTGSLAELGPILDELCRTTEDPSRLRGYLLQRSRVAAELGDRTGARMALSRAIEIDPAEQAPRQELANMLFDAQQYAKARPLLEGLLEDEDMMSQDIAVELHYRVARCAMEAADRDGAAKHVGIVLAQVPDHRGSLFLRSELDSADPFAHAASQLALANIAPPEEKANRFAALGDRYVELGDPMTAREMYREALAHRPGDHLLLTKFLHLVAEDGDWSYALDLVQRLVDTEKDPKVRARYRHTAAMIARDELTDNDLAMSLFEQSLDDDPTTFAVADEYEALLSNLNDYDELVRFYYKRLEAVRVEEGREGERLRLWDRLASLCMALDRTDDALAAYEVGLSLAPETDKLNRHIRLAEIYQQTNNLPAAIVQHQGILRYEKRRIASYEALRVLYSRTKQGEKALACADALTAFGEHPIKDRILALFGQEPIASTRPTRSLTNDDWYVLSRIDVDMQLSALFSLVAPSFASDRTRLRPPQGMPAREQDVPANIAKVLAQVVKVFGVASPPVYLDREQIAPCALTMRARAGVLVPVLVIGRPALDDQLADAELAFAIARQLADLRNDRIARLLCPRPGELAQIIELATSNSEEASHSAKWLNTSLHPVELDQTKVLGSRLRERGIVPLRAALDWMAATERAADRIGFVVVGDLAACVRVLERDQTGDRVTELVWSSVTEEVLAVRGRVEGWNLSSERKTQSAIMPAQSDRS